MTSLVSATTIQRNLTEYVVSKNEYAANSKEKVDSVTMKSGAVGLFNRIVPTATLPTEDNCWAFSSCHFPMDRFLAIDAFVRVAESQSFAEAARQMRVSRSVVTARIQQLEEFVGAPLFHRNTRSVRLSELGRAFLEDCSDLVGKTNQVVDQMREATTSPIGRFRVHALPGFVLGHLTQMLKEFQATYPKIVIELVVNDAVMDPVKEGFDCALQIFPPRSEELIARELFPVRRVMCATPGYLKRFGTPRHPRDLVGHRIGWYSGYPTRERLDFYRDGDPIAVRLEPVMLSNSVHLLLEYCLEGAGIVCLPTLVASQPMLDGSLQVVLPEFNLSSFPLSVFYPTSLRSTLKLRLFLEMLTAAFPSPPPWDEMLIAKKLMDKEIIRA